MEKETVKSVDRPIQILVVDDDDVTCQLLKEILSKEGYQVETEGSGESAIDTIRNKLFPIIVSDIRMISQGGMDVLRAVKKVSPQTAVILMTGFGSMEGAIEAIQEGAFDYVSKPFRIEELKGVVYRAAKHWESLECIGERIGHPFVQQSNQKSGTESHNPRLDLASKVLIGKSPKIVEIYKLLARAALSASTVFISGESGTGKELVARAIHKNSQRRARQFVAVNCGALTESLLESELFGHVRGAFTGAIADKKGLFEEASGGTLFLDEVGDLSQALQIKLLRVLQEGEVRPVGATESRKVDVRLIAATHRDLEVLVKAGKFREDLYYRLKVISLEIPPLRDRLQDLPELVDYFLGIYSKLNKKNVSHLSDEALHCLKNYTWPGNIRELEHAIERAVAMTNTKVIFPEDFPDEIVRAQQSHPGFSQLPQKSGKASLEELERLHISEVLQRVGYNKSKASEVLGIDRATLYRKAQKYGIELRGK